MALSGTVTGSVTNKASTFSFYFVWSATQDVAANCSYVTVSSYWSTSNRGATFDTVSARPASITINGTQTSISKRFTCNPWPSDAKYLIQTVSSFRVDHNVDGTKTITISARANGTASTWGPSASTSSSDDCVASAAITLDTIPRGATISQNLGGKTETTLTINWSTDDTVDKLWYSIDNGGTYTAVSIASSSSGSYTITGLTANTTYPIKTKVRRKSTQVTSESSALSVKTYNWPYASVMPDFVIGASVTVTVYNPLSRTVSVRLMDSSNTVLATVSVSGTSAVFDTSSIADTLYATIPNAVSGTYKVRCVTDGHTINKTGGTYSVNPAVCAPEITAVAYADINATTIALTGDDQDIVQSHSQVEYTATGLTAKKSASLVSCSVLVNGATVNLTVSGTSATGGNAVINSGTDVTAVFTVTDSRGLTGTKSVTVKMLPWAIPSAIITAQRQNNSEATTELTCDAMFSDINGNNTITISYEATKAGDLTPTYTGSLQDNVMITLNLDIGYAWSIKITLTDALGGTKTYTVSVAKVIPIVYVDRLRESVGINQLPNHDGTLEINGDVYINSKLVDAWVVDSGTSNYWRYKKYSDGTFEAWRSRTGVSMTCSTAGQLSGWYRSSRQGVTLPSIGIATIGYAAVTVICPDNSYPLQFATVSGDTTTSILYYYINSPISYSSQSRDIDYIVRGTWS